MHGGVLRTAACAVGAAVALALIAGPAIAVTMNANYDAIDSTQGISIAGVTTVTIAGSSDLGSLTTAVAFCPQPSGCIPGVYTYSVSVIPKTTTTGISAFSTDFPGGVPGLTGLAGWSYESAILNGVQVGMSLDSLGNLTWTVTPSWNRTIIFFYQSTIAPGTNMYSLSDPFTGEAAGFAPVPEPASLLLVASSFAGVAIAMRWRGRDGVFPRQ